jgi:hypothetical protein
MPQPRTGPQLNKAQREFYRTMHRYELVGNVVDTGRVLGLGAIVAFVAGSFGDDVRAFAGATTEVTVALQWTVTYSTASTVAAGFFLLKWRLERRITRQKDGVEDSLIMSLGTTDDRD